MAATQFGIDLGQVYQARNAFADQQQKQQLNALALQKGQMELDQAPEMNALALKKGKLEVSGLEQTQQLAKHTADVKATTDTLGALDTVPDEQLAQATQAAKANLASQGITTAAIDQAIQSSGNDPAKLRVALKQQAQAGLGYAAQLAEQDKAATRKNASDTLAETSRHNKAAEDQAAVNAKNTANYQQGELNKPVSVSPGNNLVSPSGKIVYNGSAQVDGSPVPGVVGHPEIDATAPGYATQIAGNTGLTQASIDQKALSYVTSGTLPPQGRTGIAGIQNAAISNRMAEMGQGTNLAANKTQLKALSGSLATQQKYLDNTQRAFNTANDTLDALQTYMAKNNVNPSEFPDYNRFANYLKSKGIDPGTAGGYNAQIATLRAEYSQVLARGGVRSVETDKEAAKLIPDGLSPKDLAKVAAQIKIDGNNVVTDAQNQLTKISGQVNGIIKPPAKAGTAAPPPASGNVIHYDAQGNRVP